MSDGAEVPFGEFDQQRARVLDRTTADIPDLGGPVLDDNEIGATLRGMGDVTAEENDS
ncbi:hypothetical protein ACIF9R_24330 [Streptomyces sp. NPDC086080]|uniref:hypothetical protein n=1 Tax=Streptomyces sp. NPDC086080 TaxID=3365748 RepID=UPI0037CFF11F